MLETIVFTFGELTNATTEATEIILNLESDDDPNLVSVEADPLEFAEHEFSTITATIDQATSRDVIIPISVSGTATLDSDYSIDFASMGDALPQYNSLVPYNKLSVLADGRLVGRSDWNWNGLYIHELDGTITEINLTEPAYDFTTNQNDIYFTNSRKIIKYDVATSSEELIYEYTGNNDVRRIDVVNDKIFVMWMNNDAGNVMTFDYIAEGNDPVNISEHAGYPGDGLQDFAVNSQEDIYVTNSDNIWKVIPDTNLEENILIGFNGGNIGDMKFFGDNLYIKYYDYQLNGDRITRINPSNFTVGSWTEYNAVPLDYDWAQATSNFNGYAIDNFGQLLVALQCVTNDQGVYDIILLFFISIATSS